jgi:hypothetical protein
LDTNVSEDHAAPIFRVEMEAAWFSETFVCIHCTKWHKIPENREIWTEIIQYTSVKRKVKGLLKQKAHLL